VDDDVKQQRMCQGIAKPNSLSRSDACSDPGAPVYANVHSIGVGVPVAYA